MTAHRAGQAMCNSDIDGLYLVMVEHLALDHLLDGMSRTDPNYAGVVKNNSSKQNWTSVVLIQFAQSRACIHEFFAEYFSDKSPEG